MFASSLVQPRSRVPSGDVPAEVPRGAADLDADEVLSRRWHDEPGAAHGAAAGDAFAGLPGDNGPGAAHLVGAADALAGLPEHDGPDAAALADADDAAGVLERWAWFEDPRADDWWVGDALEDAAACLPGPGETPAAAAAEVRAVRPSGRCGRRPCRRAGR